METMVFVKGQTEVKRFLPFYSFGKNQIFFLLFMTLFVVKAELLIAQPISFTKVIYDGYTTGSVQAYSLLQTPSGNLLAGWRTYQPMAMMVSDSGNVLWCKTYDSGTKEFACAVNTNDNAILLAGSRIYEYSNGPGDVILVKITLTGDTIWSEKLDFGGDDFPLSLQSTNDGGFILAGTTEKNDSSKIFIAKLSSAGSLIWGRTIQSGRYYNTAFAALQTPDQGYLLAGYIGGDSYDSPICMTLIKVTSNGGLSWAKKYLNSTMAYDLLSSGGYYYCLGVSPWGTMMMKFDTAGYPYWGKFYTGYYTSLYQHRPGPRLRRCSGGDFAFIMGTEDNVGLRGMLYRTDMNGDLLFSRFLQMYAADLIPKNDTGLLVCGNGPLMGVYNSIYTPQVGVIKMDAQGDPGYCAGVQQYTSSTFSPALTTYSPTIKIAGTVSMHNYTVTSVTLHKIDDCVSIYPGIEEQEAGSEISVFPNPTRGEITIGKTKSEPMLLSHIEIHDFSGNLISCIEGPVTNKLNLEFLSNGIYLLSAFDGNKKYSFKLIISHN